MRPSGTVSLWGELIDWFSCRFDHYAFPFDKQNCTLTIQLFDVNAHFQTLEQVIAGGNLEYRSMVEEYRKARFDSASSGEWELLTRKAVGRIVRPPPDGSTLLRQNIQLRRFSLFHQQLWVTLPTLLVAATQCCLVLACDRRQRFAFGGATLIALMLLCVAVGGGQLNTRDYAMPALSKGPSI